MVWLKGFITLATAVAPIITHNRNQKKKEKDYISDRIYVGFMSGEYTEQKARDLCAMHRIRFPPKPKVYHG